MNYQELHELKEYLQVDSRISSINPVRLINVNSMVDWKHLKAFLLSISATTLSLSSLCEDQDVAPNLNRLKSKIRKSSSNTLIIPLSEYLRINNAIALKTLQDILKIQFESNENGKLRIYIPLYRMREILQKISLDPRQHNCIHYLQSSEDVDYSLTIVQDDLDIDIEGNQTKGYREYLTYWEQNPDKPVIFHTKNAIYLKDIIFSDDVIVILSSYDLLRHHYKLPIELLSEYGDESDWKALSMVFKPGKSIENVICQLLPAHDYSQQLFQNWKSYDRFKRWLLWIWTKYRQPKGYLGIVSKKSSSLDEFIVLIYSELLEHLETENFSSYAQQRKDLLKNMGLSPSHIFMKKVYRLEPINQILCLTDLTIIEKRALLVAFSKCEHSRAVIDRLKNSYNDAYYYLEEIGFDELKLKDYFSNYNRLKLTNKTSDEFFSEVNAQAKQKNELMFKLKSRNLLVNENYDSKSKILFVDALGIEYATLIIQLFKGGKYFVEAYIGRCNFPSTTKYNRDFFEGKNHYRMNRLDEIKHSSEIKFPDNIITEFEILHEVKNKADEILEEYDAVIITADHGSSRLAVLYRDQAPVYQCKENAVLEKYGRYCIDSLNDYSEIEGIIHDHDKWIFANYARFAERGAPQCEIHGGASYEEMIVPIIKVRRIKEVPVSPISEKITVLTPSINVGPSGNGTISFKLVKIYPQITAQIESRIISCEFIDGEYQFSHVFKTSGLHRIRIKSNEVSLGEFTVNIIKGITETDFDL